MYRKGKMKETQTVYKATFNGLSWCHWINIPGAVLKYSIGTKTVPTYGKILAFSNKADLINFVKDKMASEYFDKIVIFKGIGTNAETIKLVSSFHEFSMVRFWETRKMKKRLSSVVGTIPAPKGTVAVDSFEPTQEFYFEEFEKG